jgi:glucose-6-phosphate isomerase
MQLPDEAVSLGLLGALFQPAGADEWRPEVELKVQHLLSPQRLKDLFPRLNQARSQVATEREMVLPPLALQPLDAAFINLPDRLLTELRRKQEASELGLIQSKATWLRENVDRVVILGIGGSSMGPRALFESLKSAYHNELPPEGRMGVPRVYFEGNNVDNDAMQDLLDLLQQTCVNPDTREERWAVIVISKSGGTLETAAAFRVLRREAGEYYGPRSEWLKHILVPVTGEKDSQLRALCKADGYEDNEIFTVPEHVGGRFSVFSAVGLLPAAVMGLDVRALLLGAASTTKQFIEEPVERNPVLLYAGLNYLLSEEMNKPIRVMCAWSKKLEALGLWYDQLLAESLGKLGRGPTPITAVATRDLHSRGQQHQEGKRDKVITNLVVKATKHAPIPMGMSDRNEDGLNEFNRKTYPDLMNAALKGTNEAYAEAARPTIDLVLPSISEYTMGQLLQMLMLATVIEGRMIGVNPYGQPGVQAYKRKMMTTLRTPPPSKPQA